MEQIPDHPVIRQIERTGYPWYDDEYEDEEYEEEESDDE